MTRRLVVIGIVAAVTALVGTKLVLLAVGGRPGPGFKYLAWPIYIRVVIVSVALWVGIGSLFIRKRASFWVGLVAGVLSPAIGVILVNPVFIFLLAEAPLQFGAVGLVTGALVWLIARGEGWGLGEAA